MSDFRPPRPPSNCFPQPGAVGSKGLPAENPRYDRYQRRCKSSVSSPSKIPGFICWHGPMPRCEGTVAPDLGHTVYAHSTQSMWGVKVAVNVASAQFRSPRLLQHFSLQSWQSIHLRTGCLGCRLDRRSIRCGCEHGCQFNRIEQRCPLRKRRSWLSMRILTSTVPLSA